MALPCAAAVEEASIEEDEEALEVATAVVSAAAAVEAVGMVLPEVVHEVGLEDAVVGLHHIEGFRKLSRPRNRHSCHSARYPWALEGMGRIQQT